MKRLLSAVALFLVIGISAPAFAFIDGELFGGYNFQGSYSTDIKTVSVKGVNYGGRAHLNGGVLGIASYGVGIFAQNTPLKYDLPSASYSLQKTDIGPDAYVRLGIIPVLKPYLRTGLSFYEYTKDNNGNKSNSKYFNTAYYGGGIGLMPPIPVLDLMIYGEYLYNTRLFGKRLDVNTINFGVLIGI